MTTSQQTQGPKGLRGFVYCSSKLIFALSLSLPMRDGHGYAVVERHNIGNPTIFLDDDRQNGP